jgi:hypothetical protein
VDAATAASAVGLGAQIVYADIEQYDSSYQYANNTCGAAVSSFVEGFVYELKNSYKYKAVGFYANSVDAQSDIWTASPRPDDIWVPRYDTRTAIWGLDENLVGGLADSTWPEGFRAHQYFNYPDNAPNGPRGEEYGDSQTYQIDRDIEYAQVGGGNGGKEYSYCSTCFVQLDAYGGPTSLAGINDAGMGRRRPARRT